MKYKRSIKFYKRLLRGKKIVAYNKDGIWYQDKVSKE